MLTPRRAAVLGRPISHSLSPVLHRAAYATLGLDWRYDAIEVDSDGLPGFLGGLGEEWVGLSLTMPLKEAVLPHLTTLTDLARLTRSANTVLFGPGGPSGDNTDVYGIVEAVRSCGSGHFASACVVGAGATARSAVAAAVQLGARRITIVARRPEAAAASVQVAAELSADASVVPWADAAEALAMDLVVSTVPGDAAVTLVDALPQRPGALLDVTYYPWPTSLAQAWQARGGVVVGGSEMLLWQAARQVELMTGLAAPVDAMRAALEAARRRQG